MKNSANCSNSQRRSGTADRELYMSEVGMNAGRKPELKIERSFFLNKATSAGQDQKQHGDGKRC